MIVGYYGSINWIDWTTLKELRELSLEKVKLFSCYNDRAEANDNRIDVSCYSDIELEFYNSGGEVSRYNDRAGANDNRIEFPCHSDNRIEFRCHSDNRIEFRCHSDKSSSRNKSSSCNKSDFYNSNDKRDVFLNNHILEAYNNDITLSNNIIASSRDNIIDNTIKKNINCKNDFSMIPKTQHSIVKESTIDYTNRQSFIVPSGVKELVIRDIAPQNRILKVLSPLKLLKLSDIHPITILGDIEIEKLSIVSAGHLVAISKEIKQKVRKLRCKHQQNIPLLPYIEDFKNITEIRCAEVEDIYNILNKCPSIKLFHLVLRSTRELKKGETTTIINTLEQQLLLCNTKLEVKVTYFKGCIQRKIQSFNYRSIISVLRGNYKV